MAEMQFKPANEGVELVPAEGVISGEVAPIGEHPSNFDAVCHDQVGQYQKDTDVKGTEYVEPAADEEEQQGGETPAPKTDPTLAFSPSTANATVGQAFTAPDLTNPQNLTVTYSSTNEAVATVDASTGIVTIVAAGDAVIKATFDGNDQYNAAEATYALTVAAAA